MWQQINKIVHKNKNKDRVNCIKTEKGIVSDPFVIGNKFNEFYTSKQASFQNESKIIS